MSQEERADSKYWHKECEIDTLPEPRDVPPLKRCTEHLIFVCRAVDCYWQLGWHDGTSSGDMISKRWRK